MSAVVKCRQQYHDIYSIAFLALMVVLTLVKAVSLIALGRLFTLEALAIGSVLALLGVIMYLCFTSELKLKIGKKSIQICIEPLGWTRYKFGKADLRHFEFFHADPIMVSSGLFVHFGNSRRIYNFGDSNGLRLFLANGKEVVIFSNELLDRKKEIESALN